MIFLFVHIAKTAGSSVNRFFQERLGESACLVHQESNPAWSRPPLPDEFLDGVQYISGHMPYRVFTARLLGQPLHTLTVLRDPRHHVVSHLAWIRHLKDAGQENRLAAHPDFIQVLAEKIALHDLSDPASLSHLVAGLNKEEYRLLDNPQVLYLTHRNRPGEGLDERDVEYAIDTLREVDTFGFVDELGGFFAELSEVVGEASEVREVPHENALVDRYGLSTTNEAQMQALMPLIMHDMSLYERAKHLKQERREGAALPTYRRRDARGHLSQPNPRGHAGGWAFDMQRAGSVQLDVYLNDKHVAVVEAARARKDLREKFERDCAFVIDLNKLKARSGDRLAVFFQGTNIELNGSPRELPAEVESTSS
ncbi:hypothetical protein [Halomonas lysinitropha]|uniref:Sulfotransferase family protein n=1 Tax=Halomonas lysinitropha TaxID=2607506 RepID=A0A5K1I2S3_9GAMM|nr:hypothetical protein [Halomonas lysinitropha]VVZ95745.1 hypothetical protein HALO32_01824 [Halomonas lysinitropha]